MKRVLVCGGRDYGRLDPKRTLDHPKRMGERRKLREVLTGLAAKFGGFQMIHGGACGADALAHGFWSDNVLLLPEPLVFAAAWDDISVLGAVVKKHKKFPHKPYNVVAGLQRNSKMLEEGKPDLVVAFAGGTGTADMVKKARDAGVEVLEID